MREARRPRDGGVISGEAAAGRGRIAERPACGVLADMWCHVRE